MHSLLTFHHTSTFIPTQNTHIHLFFHHYTTNSPTYISNHSHPFNHSPNYHSHTLPSILSLYIPSTTPINTLTFSSFKTFIISFTTQQHTTNTFLSPLKSKNHLPFPPILIHLHNSPTLPSPQPTYP